MTPRSVKDWLKAGRDRFDPWRREAVAKARLQMLRDEIALNDGRTVTTGHIANRSFTEEECDNLWLFDALVHGCVFHGDTRIGSWTTVADSRLASAEMLGTTDVALIGNLIGQSWLPDA